MLHIKFQLTTSRPNKPVSNAARRRDHFRIRALLITTRSTRSTSSVPLPHGAVPFYGLNAVDLGRHRSAIEILTSKEEWEVARGLGRRPPRGGQGYRCHDWVMSNREEFLTWFRSVLWDAEVAIHNGDAGPRRAIWSCNDPVTVLGALKNASGQQELDELFAHLAESFSDCTSYEFDLLEAEVLGDAAYTVGFEHTSASVNGVPRTYTLRATQIYRREDDAWKVAHRHGSTPPE